MRISVREGTFALSIMGHGIIVDTPKELVPGLLIDPSVPSFDIQEAAEGCSSFMDYAAVVAGKDLANFSIRVSGAADAEELAAAGWDALWIFHLLSLAAQAPCCSLFTVTHGGKATFSAANRNVFVRAFPTVCRVEMERLDWVCKYYEPFLALAENPVFSAAMRCFGNAHYLPDFDMRVMLLWSGIEGLLSVDGELNRRLALYSALMIEGTGEEKLEWFGNVKKAYSIRSKAVHGGSADQKTLQAGYQQASRILSHLLARCVEIGRVPKPSELDALALTATIR